MLLHRELHTLKGESKMLGFGDVNVVCHKLEDLIDVARSRGYAVTEDFDQLLRSALQFMTMLLHKKLGSGEADLAGLLDQIDSLLVRQAEHRPARTTTGPILEVPAGSRIPPALRSRLSTIAVDAYIEYASARGLRRDRLRASWHDLRYLIGIQRVLVTGSAFAKHKTGADLLARELDKQVEVTLEIAIAEATAEIVGALDTALLHLIRNAVDHGIETPAARTRAGKSTPGTITVRSQIRGDVYALTVEDDGCGVALEEVRARALDMGLITPGDLDISDRWFDLVSQPGFTTRSEANDISGRGVGLDAARIAIHEAGGRMTATTSSRGTSWHIEIRLPTITFSAHVLRVPGVAFQIVIDDSWQHVDSAPASTRVVDLAHSLGLATDPISQPTAAFFRRNNVVIGFAVDAPPRLAKARKVIDVPPPALRDVVLVETTEALRVYPEQLAR